MPLTMPILDTCQIGSTTMSNHVLARRLFVFALMAVAAGPMAGCGVLVWRKDFDDYKTIMTRELAAIDSKADANITAVDDAKTTAEGAEKTARGAKEEVVAATTAAADASTKAVDASIKADTVAKENRRIDGVINDGLKPRLDTTEQNANASKRRLKTLDDTDLPALKNGIATLKTRCEVLETAVANLTTRLKTEEEARTKLAEKVTDLDTSLAAEKEARTKQEGVQAKINTAAQKTATDLAVRVTNNETAITTCDTRMTVLTKSTDTKLTDQNTKLDGQDKIVKVLRKAFLDMLVDNKKLFGQLLSATMTAQKTVAGTVTTSPTTQPAPARTTRSTTKPAVSGD